MAEPAPASHHPRGVLVGRQLRDMLVFHPGHLVGQIATVFDGCKKLKRGLHGENLARLGNPDQTERLMGLIPKSGWSCWLWQPEEARFCEKSDCIALYSGCGSYQLT